MPQAQRLGFGPRTPIYYDMEAYPAKTDRGRAAVPVRVDEALHRLDYRSGVYSSSWSGVVDLARQYARHQYAMPDAIYDALWNGSRMSRTSRIRPGECLAGNHRLHQFSGNDTQKYGGVKIDVDKDYLDIGLADPGGTACARRPPSSRRRCFYEGIRSSAVA